MLVPTQIVALMREPQNLIGKSKIQAVSLIMKSLLQSHLPQRVPATVPVQEGWQREEVSSDLIADI